MASTEEKASAIQNASVDLQWTCDVDDTVKRLGAAADHAALDFGLNQSTREAYFKLRVPVALKGLAKKTPFFLYIKPEHILKFLMAAPLTTTSPSLHISLLRPSLLVGPPSPAVPKSKKASDTLDLLKSLARATSLIVRFSPGARYDELAASFQSASTLLAERQLRSSPDEHRLERLYAGKGGVPVDVGSRARSSSTDPLQLRAGSPPSYDELGPSPPPPPTKKAKRRKRGSSSTHPGPATKKGRASSPPPPSEAKRTTTAAAAAAAGHEKASAGSRAREKAEATENDDDDDDDDETDGTPSEAEEAAEDGRTWAAHEARQTALDARQESLAAEFAALKGQVDELTAARAATATTTAAASERSATESAAAAAAPGIDHERFKGLQEQLMALREDQAALRRDVEERMREGQRRAERRVAELAEHAARSEEWQVEERLVERFQRRLEAWEEASAERVQESVGKKMEDRLVERLVERFERRLEEVSGELEERLEESVARWMEEGVDQRFEEAVDDAVEQADAMIDDRTVHIKDEMISFVREELQNVKDELMDGFDLGNAVLRVEFDH